MGDVMFRNLAQNYRLHLTLMNVGLVYNGHNRSTSIIKEGVKSIKKGHARTKKYADKY